MKQTKKFSYAQGWNACLLGKKRDAAAHPEWLRGFDDSAECDPDDVLPLVEDVA